MGAVTDDAPAAPAAHGAGAMSRPLRQDPLALVALLLPLVPFVVAAAAARSQEWWPALDLSLIDLRIRDVGGENTPLLGPFSRFGWSHPGPLMFWLLAPAYRMLGSTASAGLAAAALQNAVVVVGIGLVAHRLGGRRFLLVTSLCVAALCRSLGGELLASTWNPWLTLLPFALFLLLAWGVSLGDRTLVPWSVAVGSFLIQTHVAYLPLIAALGAWGAAWLAVGAVRARRRGDDGWAAQRRSLLRAAGLSALVGGLLWIGPLIEQATRDPGNARILVSFFWDSPAEPAGFAVAANVMARELSPAGPWLGGPEPLDFLACLKPTSHLLALPMVALWLGAAVVGWRRRDTPALLLLGTAAIGIGAGAVATSRIIDVPHYYLFRWWWVLAMVGWLAITWTFLQAIAGATAPDAEDPARRSAAERVGWLLAPAVVAVTAVLVLATSLGATDPVPSGPHQTAVEAITPTLVDVLDANRSYWLRPIGLSWYAELYGIGNQLDRAGIAVRADAEFAPQFGAGRTVAEGGSEDEILLVATGLAVEDTIALRTGELLADWDPLPPEKRAELVRLQREQSQALVDAGLPEAVGRVENTGIAIYALVQPAVDPEAAARIAELLSRGVRVAVFRAGPPELRSH